MTVSRSTLIDSLRTLKTHYEQKLSQIEVQAIYHREQLAHINALLLEQLLLQGQSVSSLPPLPDPNSDPSVITLPSPLEIPLAHSDAAPAVIAKPQRRAKPKTNVAQRLPSPLLLPLYQGLTKLEAIQKVLESRRESLSIDTLNQALYGNLTPQQLQTERPRLRTFLHRGVQRGLWQKDPNTSCYFSHPTFHSLSPDRSADLGRALGRVTILKAVQPRRKRRAKVAQSLMEVKQPGKPKHRQVELVALLKNADSLV